GFAAASGMNLRLDDHDVRFEALGGFASLVLRESDLAARRGDTIARENRLSLIFVNLHSGSSVWATAEQCSGLEFFLVAKHKSVLGTPQRSKNTAWGLGQSLKKRRVGGR